MIDALWRHTAFLDNGIMTRVLEVGAVDTDLMDPDRQAYVLRRFMDFVSYLNFPIQIIAATRRQDISSWLHELEARKTQWELGSLNDKHAKRLASRLGAQIDFIRGAHESTNPRGQAYYIAIPFRPKAALLEGNGDGLSQGFEELRRRQEQVTWGLQDLGLPYKVLSAEELGRVIFRFYHREYQQKTPPEKMVLASEEWEWPTKATGPTFPTRRKRKEASEADPLTLRDKLAPGLQKLYVDHFQFSDTCWGRVYYVWDFPGGLETAAFRRILDFPAQLEMVMFIAPMQPREAHQALKKMRVSMAAEQIGDAKEGKLATPGKQADFVTTESELTKMEIGGENLYWLSLYLGLSAVSKEELESLSRELEDRLIRANLTFHRAGGLQERGIQSLLPLGTDRLHQRRNMNAQALAGFFPFVRKTYLEPDGIPYGIHRQNGTWVVLDDFHPNLSNPNSLILGKPGMGKSVFLKHRMEHAVLLGQRVYALDLEGEFRLLARDLGGIYLDMGGESPHKMNVLDLNPEDERPLHAGLATFKGWLEIAVGRRLTPMEKNVIIPTAYERAMKEAGITAADKSSWANTPPRLSDIANILRTDQRTEARDLAACLYPYAFGLQAGDFNCQTNVDLTGNPLVVFGLKGVERDMLPVRMFQVEAFIGARVLRGVKKPTRVMVDEAWHMLSRPGSAEALAEMSRRFRKHYAGLDISTQQAADLATSRDAQIIRDNVATVLLFAQNEPAAKALGSLFGLNNTEVAMLPALRKGEALLLREGTHIPIYLPVPPERYPLYTTSPRDMER